MDELLKVALLLALCIVGTGVGVKFARYNDRMPPLQNGQRGFNVFVTGAITGAAMALIIASF